MRKLGHGAQGIVYQVRSKLNNKLWVIKKVDMKKLSYEERIQAREEARILECLNHPNVIKFKDVFKDKGLNLNIVMEYADGGELADLIR